MTSAPALASWRPAPAARVRSWLGDWLVVACWLVVLTVLGVLARPLLAGSGTPGPPGARALLATDLAVLLATVVPYVVYLSVTETSARRATWGKRWAGLEVAGAEGDAPARARVWLRNVVKALPWQLAHLGVVRIVLDVGLTAAAVLQVLALVLAATCMVPSLVGGRGLHDRLAGTRVQRARPEPVGGLP